MRDKVEQLTAEGLISMKCAAELYGGNTHKSTPTRHALRGYNLPNGKVVHLEAFRIGGSLKTSKAAVLRFFQAQNETEGTNDVPVAVPTTSRVAAQAHAALASALGL